MKIFSRFAAAAFIGATVFTGLAAAAPASARTHVSVEIGGRYGPRFGPAYGHGYYGRGYYGHGYGYGPGWGRPYGWGGPVRYQPVCWTDWRWDPYWQESVPVRYCR